MDVSIFLARFLGVYLILVTLIFFFRPQQIYAFAKNTFQSPAILPVTGVIALLFGLAIVIAQPIFEFNWKGVITLIGLISIVKGVIRLGFPEEAEKMLEKMLEKKNLWVLFIISLLIGLFLTWKGFF